MKKVIFVFLIISVLFLFSCSSNNSVMTDLRTQGNQDKTFSTLPVFISDYDSSGNPLSGMGIIGLFHVHVDTQNLKGGIVSLRNADLTDVLEVVDITNFLQLAPCTNCVRIAAIRLDSDGNTVVTIGIKHPFDVGDPLKPISGRNRADLHVFNVEGIIAVNYPSVVSFPSLKASVVANPILRNADGYTNYLDESLDDIFPTNANLHPYKLHFRDYSKGNYDASNPMGFESVTTPPPSGNLVMAMGSDYDYKDYVFSIPDGAPFDFIFSVGCTYAVSAATKSQRFAPEYRIPQHNKKAASEVHVEVISNNLRPGNTSSTAELKISVLDMNHGVAVGSSLDRMAFDSSVANILVEVPGITLGTQSNYVFNGGDGRDPSNPLIYTATLTNVLGAGSGSYLGVVKVLDSYPTGQNTSPLLNSKDGIKRVNPLENPLNGLFTIKEFATYNVFAIEIGGGEPQDPIAVIKTIPSPATVTTQYASVLFDGSDSYDPDGGSITKFEWDFDWDGNPSNFNPDVVGMFPQVEHNYQCLAKTYLAALRVTDDDNPAGVSSIASIQVTITDNFVPGTWMGTVSLGAQDIAGDSTYHTGQMLSVDSNNLVHIITYSSNAIYHRTFNGSTVSPPTTIPGVPANFKMVTSETDNNDELHVVWIVGYGEGTKIQHTVTSGGSFTGIIDTLATSGATNPYYESMNIRKNNLGHIMIVWLGRDYYFDPYSYFEYTINTGGGFSPPAQIPYKIEYGWGGGASVMQSPNLLATPNGYFHQIDRWRESNTSYIVRIFDIVYDGSQWQPPRIAGTNPTNSNAYTDVTACAGADGDIHITGRHHTENDTYYIRYDADSDTWLSPIKMSDTSHPWPYGPMGAIEVSPSGYVHSVYVSETDNKLHLKIFCQFWDAQTILSTPDTVIDPSVGDQVYGHADVAWDNEGNLLAIYRTSSSIPNETGFNCLNY